MRVIVQKRDESEQDRLGPDLLKDVRTVDLIGLTPNMVKALLILLARVGGSPDTTLRGELEMVQSRLLHGLGVPTSDVPWAAPEAARYAIRDDLIEGRVRFLKGGAWV